MLSQATCRKVLRTSLKDHHLRRMLEASKLAAVHAGDFVRENFYLHFENTHQPSLHVWDKHKGGNGHDPFTIVDVTSQAKVFSMLRNAGFGGITMIGEEDLSHFDWDQIGGIGKGEQVDDNAMSELAEETVIWVDPLDGTSDFVKGNLESATVMVGIAIKGKPIGGVIHHPFSGMTMWGLQGVGLFGNIVERRQHRDKCQARILTTTSRHCDRMQGLMSRIQPASIIRCCGAGYKFLQILQDTADAYVHPYPGTRKWDTCAGEALLRLAGGDVSTVYGDIIDYGDTMNLKNGDGLAASLGVCQQDLLLSRSDD